MRRLLLAVIAFALFGGVARADVLYSYTGADYLAGSYFKVQSATFLPYSDSAVSTSSGEVVYGGTDYGALAQVHFLQSYTLEISAQSGAIITQFPLNYTISQYGTYTGKYGTLVVSNTVTPEPSSLALLGTGLLGVIGASRRRWA